MRRVHIIATGGTIAGLKSADREFGYSPGELSAEMLLAMVPGIENLAKLSVEQIFNIGSQDIDEGHWLRMLDKIRDHSRRFPDTGIVVLHGTDTLEETAWFLDLNHDGDNPVVLVGAMRPANAISADGPANLIAGIITAADPQARGRGVLVCSDNEVMSARSTTKSTTIGIQGFSAGKRGIEACLSGGRIEWLRPRLTHRAPRFAGASAPLPLVEIVYVHAAMSERAIESLLALGPDGIVVAGVGGGNMPRMLIDRLSQAATEGTLVVRSSRIPGGHVSRNIEIDDDAHGFVAAADLSPAKARILLQLALLQTRDAGEIQAMFSAC